jgi:DNA processing protein
MTTDLWRSALRLHLTPGLGLRRNKLLVQALGGCPEVLDAPDLGLRDLLGERLWMALRSEPPEWAQATVAVSNWLGSAPAGLRHRVLAWGDPDYPTVLADLPDPPLLLFITDAEPQDAPVHWPAGVALVGSRGATPQGLAITRQWATKLTDAGWCVVSGLAHGIDAAAHGGALQSSRPGLLTMAVMGTGPDLVYPSAHASLKARIAARGRCVTEFLPGVRARKMHFPLRNRLLIALSAGVVVVEADLQSGSLISAQCALDLGREVMAVPGSIRSPLSQGCHALLRQGANLVTCSAEVLAALPPLVGQASPWPASPPPTRESDTALLPPLDPAWVQRVRQALGHDPWTLDELQARLGDPWTELQAGLETLEWQGLLARLPGDRVQWVGHGVV